MNIDKLQSGMHSGMVLSSTVSVPSPADAIAYTIGINVENGTVVLENVTPQRDARWSSYMPVGPNGELPNLYPFPPGHRVPIHVERQGDTLTVFIDRGEIPAFGGCVDP